MNNIITNTAYTVLVIALVSWMVAMVSLLYCINQNLEVLVHNQDAIFETLDMVWGELFLGHPSE